MFPEGTRIPRGEVGDYKTGGTRLAIEAGLPVVPIAATAARCWPRKSFLLRPGVVDISIGRQIRPEGRQPAELMQEVKDWIESEMRRLDPEAYVNPQPAGVAGAAHPR
jgi:1-acyl-sn-glycerol-3-phosphate acyltransferase